MIMQDKNNLQIADLILQRIEQRVTKRRAINKEARPSGHPATTASAR